jgi:hypothetical protein
MLDRESRPAPVTLILAHSAGALVTPRTAVLETFGHPADDATPTGPRNTGRVTRGMADLRVVYALVSEARP